MCGQVPQAGLKLVPLHFRRETETGRPPHPLFSHLHTEYSLAPVSPVLTFRCLAPIVMGASAPSSPTGHGGPREAG